MLNIRIILQNYNYPVYIIYAKAISGVDGPIAGGPYKGSGDSDNDNQYVYYRNGVSYYTDGAGSHNHSITTDSNIPPYFALAYIMYTG